MLSWYENSLDMTIRDVIGTLAIVLTFILFMIHGIEIYTIKQEHVILQQQVIFIAMQKMVQKL